MHPMLGMSEDELKRKLSPEEYAVLREGATEAPFTGQYVHKEADGTYSCKVCDNPLFTSDAQFDSGTGWPSFDEAIPGAVEHNADESHLPLQAGGVRRIEIVCAKCGSHLGHVFDDGPTKTGTRYCINSVCLDLEEK